MNFRTCLTTPSLPVEISHKDTILSIGSCFAENMADRLQQNKFQVLINPFGVLYNPISIGRVLNQSIDGKPLAPADLIYHNECWHSFHHHSCLSNPSKTVLKERIQQAEAQTLAYLKKANVLMLTFGTSIIYKHKASHQIVANCHKVPAEAFLKYRLSVEQVITALGATIRRIQILNPRLIILLTVSPVRHIRDGLMENQKSKATLLLAIEALQEAFSGVYYFPSYELILDDLRDYRFFEKDLVHPNELAIDYVWEHFKATFFSTATQQLLKKIESICRAVLHRPFNPTTLAHQQFLKKTLAKITQLENSYPTLNFFAEKIALRRDLKVEQNN